MKLIPILLCLALLYSCQSEVSQQEVGNEQLSTSPAPLATTTIPQESITTAPTEPKSQDAIPLVKAYNAQDYKQFFDLFPSDFKQFVALYGYSDGVGGHQLYSYYNEHIKYLFEGSSQVQDTVFYQKMYQLTQNSEWDADAVSSFGDSLFDVVLKNPAPWIRLLNQQSKESIKDFWVLLFGGSSKSDTENNAKFQKMYKAIYAYDANQGRLLKGAFDYLYH